MEKTKLKSKAGKPVYKTDEGELVSEKTIGVEMDGKEYTIPTVHKGKILEDEEAIDLFKKGKIKPVAVADSPEEGDKKAEQRSKKLLDMNIGGAPKKGLEAQQLEMFGDIGMAKSPAKRDPVSGNEIPKASTAEEVRDDIPAQLSEGEFVLPADVVRYHGLEKLMKLRQEAKQGINTMDKMGQLGNADEATIPDDLPFDINDIEMAEGGVVTPTATGTFQVPTQLSSTPSYFQNYAQTTAPFSPFASKQQTPIPPTFTPVPNQNIPTFQDLIPSQGQRPITKEYRNAAGQRLFIPFINGRPIYPIPEGYTEYKEETSPIAETKPPVTTPTTSVRDQVDGGDSNILSGTSQVRGIDNSIIDTNFSTQTADKVAENFGKMSASDRAVSVMDAVDKSKGYTGLAKGLQQAGKGILSLANPITTVATMVAGKTVNPLDIYSNIRDTGKPDMGARDKITEAFGYNVTSFQDPSGLIDDPIADARSEQNAINTAIFGGMITGTEKDAFGNSVNRGGVVGVTDKDIENAYGIAPSRDEMGFISRGTNPGQIDSMGNFYDSVGVGTDPDKAAYSSITDMLGYLSNASKHGYYGTKGQAEIDAKKGNEKAINTLRSEKQREKDKEDKEAAERGGTGDLGGIGDLGSGYGIGESTGAGSQSMGIESDVAGIGTGTGPGATAGGSTEAPGTGTDPGEPNQGEGGDSGSGGQGSSTDDGAGGVGPTAKGGFIKKPKPKIKKMKRGGLASR